MEENERLNNFLFDALDHAISSVSDGGDLVPFVMTATDLRRFVAPTLEESMEQAEKFLSELKDEPLAAVAKDGYLTIEGNKFNAVFVKAFDKDDERGIMAAQRYEPKKFLRKFQVVGIPKVVDYPENPWR